MDVHHTTMVGTTVEIMAGTMGTIQIVRRAHPTMETKTVLLVLPNNTKTGHPLRTAHVQNVRARLPHCKNGLITLNRNVNISGETKFLTAKST